MLWYLFIFPIPLSRCLPSIPALIYHTQAHTLKDIEKICYDEPHPEPLPLTFGKPIYSAISLIISLVSVINFGNVTIDDAHTVLGPTLTQCVFSQKKICI